MGLCKINASKLHRTQILEEKTKSPSILFPMPRSHNWSRSISWFIVSKVMKKLEKLNIVTTDSFSGIFYIIRQGDQGQSQSWSHSEILISNGILMFFVQLLMVQENTANGTTCCIPKHLKGTRLSISEECFLQKHEDPLLFSWSVLKKCYQCVSL